MSMFITRDEYGYAMALAEEIGAMLWSEIISTEQAIENGFN